MIRRAGRPALLLVLALACVSLCITAPSVLGASPAASWVIKSVAAPTNFSSEDTAICEATASEPSCDAYQVTVTNVGTSPSHGPIIVRDVVPGGMIVIQAHQATMRPPGSHSSNRRLPLCAHTTSEVECKWEGEVVPEGVIHFRLEVEAEPGSQRVVSNHVEVLEDGVVRAVGSPPGVAANTVNGPAPGFGIGGFFAGVFAPEGQADSLAGDHAATGITSLAWNTELNRVEVPDEDIPVLLVQEAKTDVVDLPPGLVGDAQALGSCPLASVNGTVFEVKQCPADSLAGYVSLEFSESTVSSNLYNVPPEAGYPAEFAFEYDSQIVTLLPRLLPSAEGLGAGGSSAGGYVLSASLPYDPRISTAQVIGVTVSLFGDPTVRDGSGSGEAFLTNPQDCAGGPLGTRVESDSWVDPSDWQSAQAPLFAAGSSQGVTGCGALRFDPSIAVTPEETTADTPSGYEVDLKVPQAANVPGTLATPDLKDAILALPAGVSLSPSAANGLVACQASGPEGIELGDHDKLGEGYGAQEGEEIGPDGLVHSAAGHCPAASQVGDVEVITPLLPEALKGHVYVAAPQCGGAGQPECTPQSAEDGELFGIYLEVGSNQTGIHVKLKGKVSVNPSTGRVTTTFDENPQLPFSELKLKLNGGPRAPLANPQSCGAAFTATSDITPWSTPYTPDVTPTSSFPITGCTNAFSPTFSAGMSTTLSAGAFSPFTLTFSRHDGEQDLAGLTVSMPPGLLGKIAGVEQCPEAQANAGTCPAASRIGTATASAGAGSDPYWQSGGVYLTGPYNGGPFGLSVVVPANAGPYHLGNIVTRAAIHINPETAAVSVVSNPLPQMIDGIPLRLQSVNVTVGEGGNFTFNPTNCAPASVNATLSSAQGASVPVSAPFAATGCASLPFKPGFSATTAGKASKAGGASLDVKVSYPKGDYANIKSVKVDLPKQLPSRLTTLNKACLAKVFEANPAGCPSASDVGTATATTPLLNVPVSGPAYIVSHGNEAFPDLEIVLQGEGVTIVLDGNTDIKKGITSSTFKAIPDTPVSSFELKLATGKYSILTSNVPPSARFSLCGQTLNMPTLITGQNGAVIKQTTRIGITGCPKVRKAVKQKKGKPKKKVTESTRRAS